MTSNPPDLSSARSLAKEARERATKATPGRWMVGWDLSHYIAAVGAHLVYPVGEEPAGDGGDDADFIAAARSDVPSLADLVDALADEVERLRTTVDAQRSSMISNAAWYARHEAVPPTPEVEDRPTGVCLQCGDPVFGYPQFCSPRCGDAFDADLRKGLDAP